MQSTTDDYFTKRETLAKESLVLLEKAGITKEVEQLDNLLEPDYWRDRELAPFGTEERKRQREERDASDRLAYRYGLRDIYFCVPDEDIRRRLIATEREFHDLRLTSFVSDLNHARQRLHKIEAKPSSWLSAAISGAVIVMIGDALGNLIGAIAAAVFSLIAGIYLFKEQQLRREREIVAAQADVQMCEESLRVEESRPEIFSYREQLRSEERRVGKECRL